ncbi:MAG: helix-turn-helix transcriptional regulator [Clostridiaceae bacterium]
MDTIKEKIKTLAEARGIGLSAIDVALGFGNGTIGKWDKNSPSAERLQLVADYLDVSVDYLLGREPEDMDDVMMIREQLRRRPEMKMLFDASKGATAEQILAVAEMISRWKT